MSTGAIIKRIREDKGLIQKEVSAHLGIGNSNYNKLENGHSDLFVDELQKLSILFNMTTDEILNYGNVIPKQVKVEGKDTVYKIIDTMLTKQKFQQFFEQNLQIAK